ncbi:MAG: hypothetical protein VKJ04_04245 [Vampirovibrionales bacterium]|nr:hypothetical protein [Vampirovibrionales bacterium]
MSLLSYISLVSNGGLIRRKRKDPPVTSKPLPDKKPISIPKPEEDPDDYLLLFGPIAQLVRAVV